MDPTVTLQDIVLRLLAAAVAGAILGFDRGHRGRVAGLRTTMLLCLAACGAMIEANLTLAVVGRSESSFTVMDALRFPLGILTGVGFIGAGAILKKGNTVRGVTTAATVWLATVEGLILGGGYFVLGGLLLALAIAALMGLAHLDTRISREQTAMILVERTRDGTLTDQALYAAIDARGYKRQRAAISIRDTRLLRLELGWQSSAPPADTPPIVDELAAMPGVVAVHWEIETADEGG